MAAPTLTATPIGTRRSVVVILTADTGSTCTLYRVVDGGRTAVRGVVDYAIVSGQTLFVDYELPQNTALSYVAVVTKTGVVQESNTVSVGTVDFGGDVIFDLGRPWAGMQVIVESFPTLQHDIKQDVLDVWDRQDPIVVSGQRQLPSGQLNLITLTLSARTQLLDVIRSGNVIAFAPWQPTYGVDGVGYYSIGKVTETRPSRLAAEDSRRWALDVQQVAMPPAAYLYPTGTNTWDAEKTAGTTWNTALDRTWYEAMGL